MKNFRYLCLLLVVAFAAKTSLAQPAPDPTKGVPLDGIAAVVNGSVITYMQVQDEILTQLEALDRFYWNDRSNFVIKARELQKDQLDQFIQSKLILGEYEKGAYSTNWVDPAVDQVIKDDIKVRFGGSRAKLIKTLQVMGKTYEDYVKQQREKVIVDNLAHYHTGGGKVIISPAAIEKYYADHHDDYKVDDQVKLRMIAIPTPAGSPPSASRDIAAEILKKIDGGVPFADMAKVYSMGLDRASGGDRGWVDRNHNVKALSDVAFALKPGQHSQVLELKDDRNGLPVSYILMVDDARPAHDRPLTEVQSEIEQVLRIQKARTLEQQWIDRLKASSHIEYF